MIWCYKRMPWSHPCQAFQVFTAFWGTSHLTFLVRHSRSLVLQLENKRRSVSVPLLCGDAIQLHEGCSIMSSAQACSACSGLQQTFQACFSRKPIQTEKTWGQCLTVTINYFLCTSSYKMKAIISRFSFREPVNPDSLVAAFIPWWFWCSP